MPTIRPTALLVAVGAIAVTSGPALAVVTSTWTVETYAQFDAGDASAALLTSLGELRPGWDTERVALDGDGVWAALRLADGSVLLGTDVDGAIVRVPRGGKAATKVVSLDGGIAAVALAQAPDGTVYAAAMPGDKVWKIDVAAGKATAVATLGGAETVWSLAVAADGTLYAGTGPDGQLWSIKGKTTKRVFATEDKRVSALAVAPDGAVWFGTGERALVFRHDPARNETRAMADFAGNEITAIVAARAGVAVAANEMVEPNPTTSKSAAQVEAKEQPKAPKGAEAKAPEAGTKPGADKEGSSEGRKGARKGKGAVFHVGDDGRLRQLHALTQTYVTSLAVAADGAIFVGAADKGRVYVIDPDDAVATAFDVDERAVSQLWIDDGGRLGFTSDDAPAMYRATGTASSAKYVSEAFDAKAVARFGRLTWQGDGKLTVETRTGNTAKPGPGWSEWKAPSQVGAMGGGLTGGKVASPVGRYFQFRVALGDGGARLRRASVAYAPQNQATEVKEVTVDLASKESLPTLKDVAGKARSPLWKVRWTIDNPDGDDTAYTLDVRRDGDATWRPIVTGKDRLTATSFDWNTETFPDGWYRVRVTSSDAGANSADRALTSSATTPLVVIDNQRPTLAGLRVTYAASGGRATGRATDSLTSIGELAYSLDDGPWQLGSADDGLLDDPTEAFSIALPPGLATGTHTLAVRVADGAGNVGSSVTPFVVK
ncbi:MAG: hypothetical protein R2939_16950 [Kofleriaceae bacterium]